MKRQKFRLHGLYNPWCYFWYGNRPLNAILYDNTVVRTHFDQPHRISNLNTQPESPVLFFFYGSTIFSVGGQNAHVTGYRPSKLFGLCNYHGLSPIFHVIQRTHYILQSAGASECGLYMFPAMSSIYNGNKTKSTTASLDWCQEYYSSHSETGPRLFLCSRMAEIVNSSQARIDRNWLMKLEIGRS